LSPRAEALMMAADRAQHLRELVQPTLAAGRHVVSDRSVYSSLAYQGYGRQLDLQELRRFNDFAIGGRWPDLDVLLDVDTETAMRRLNPLLDRMESKGAAFHRRVREGYLAESRRDPKRHLVVDASRTPDEVFADLLRGLEAWTARVRPVAAC